MEKELKSIDAEVELIEIDETMTLSGTAIRSIIFPDESIFNFLY